MIIADERSSGEIVVMSRLYCSSSFVSNGSVREAYSAAVLIEESNLTDLSAQTTQHEPHSRVLQKIHQQHLAGKKKIFVTADRSIFPPLGGIGKLSDYKLIHIPSWPEIMTHEYLSPNLI